MGGRDATRLAGLLLATSLALSATRALADCDFRHAATIPLQGGAQPEIDVSINGGAARMLLDTGAELTTVTPGAVVAMGLRRDLHRRTAVTLIGGVETHQNALIDRLTVGDVRFDDLSVAVVSLERNGTGVPAAGILGADELSDYDVELDFIGRTLKLYSTPSCTFTRPPWQGRYQSIPAKMSSHNQFIIPVELNGHQLTAMLDSGLFGMEVSPAAARSAGVSDADLAADPSTHLTSGGGRNVPSSRHRFDVLRIGAERFDGVQIGVADLANTDVDMLIGVPYMRTRRFFFSYSTTTLFVQTAAGAAGAQGGAGAAPNPCLPSADILPTLARAHLVMLARPLPTAPDKLKTAHLSGCAGVLFHLSADGAPTDLKLVIETPPGYGVGDFVLRQIAASKFAPVPGETAWFYAWRRYISAPVAAR
jgi:predicted aspartyl protease